MDIDALLFTYIFIAFRTLPYWLFAKYTTRGKWRMGIAWVLAYPIVMLFYPEIKRLLGVKEKIQWRSA